MAKSVSIGSLVAHLGLDDAAFSRAAGEAEARLAKLGSSMGGVITQAAALGAVAAATGLAIIAGLVKSGLEAIDAQAKLSRNLGATIDGLRAAQLAAKGAGVGVGEMNSALGALNNSIGMAQRGTGKAHESFERLGLSATALARLDADERLAAIADRFRELDLSAAQAGDELRQMGVSGVEFIDLMRQGGDAVRGARQEIVDFGLSLSAVDAMKIEKANDAIDRIGHTMESIRNHITVALAPILEELAERFNTVAKANKGFGAQAAAVVESIATGFARVADVIQGLRVVIKGIELILAGFNAVVFSIFEGVYKGAAAVTDTIIDGINFAIRGVNALGADIEEIGTSRGGGIERFLSDLGESAREHVGEVRDELVALANQEMPSAKIEAFFAAVKKRAQEAAEAAVGAAPGAGSFVSTDTSGDVEREQAEREAAARAARLQAEQEALEQRMQMLREYDMTERELEMTRHAEHIQMLREAGELGLATQDEINLLELEAEAAHQERLGQIFKKGLTEREKIEKMSNAQKLKTTIGSLTEISANVAQHNRSMFELNKAAGIANAAVSTGQAIMKTWADWGYPWGIPMVAAQAAAGLAQIQAIRSTSFGGSGGTAPSVAGSTPATPVSPVGGGAGSAGGGSLLTIEGIDPESLFSGRAVRALADRLQEHVRDGGTVQFAG